MWPVVISNKTWILVFRKALSWENDRLTKGFVTYQGAAADEQENFLKVLVSSAPRSGGRVVS